MGSSGPLSFWAAWHSVILSEGIAWEMGGSSAPHVGSYREIRSCPYIPSSLEPELGSSATNGCFYLGLRIWKMDSRSSGIIKKLFTIIQSGCGRTKSPVVWLTLSNGGVGLGGSGMSLASQMVPSWVAFSGAGPWLCPFFFNVPSLILKLFWQFCELLFMCPSNKLLFCLS